jgi:hypothetical protein
MEVITGGFINIKLRLFNIKEILKWTDEQNKITLGTLKKNYGDSLLEDVFYNPAL